MFGKKSVKSKTTWIRNCFTLAMTNKLVVIINSLKVPKIKKILLYEMKFLIPNYSCLQNPWLGGYCPQIPVLSVLCPKRNLLNPSPPPEQNSWVRHWLHVSQEISPLSYVSTYKLKLSKYWSLHLLPSCAVPWQNLMNTFIKLRVSIKRGKFFNNLRN